MGETKTKRKKPPARTPEARENQLINLAVDLAEEKLRNGTASSQIISLLLNLATTKTKLELEKSRSEIELKRAKVKEIENHDEIKELYKNAISAMKEYQGIEEYDEEDEYDEDD